MTKVVAASTFKTTVSTGKGVVAGVKLTGNSIVSAVANPVQTGKSLVSAAANPVQTAKAITKEAEKTIKKDIINGNAESRAKVITEAVLSIAGTKGISKVSSVASVASKAKKVEAVAAVASKAETVATAAGASGLKGAINSVSNRIAGFWADESSGAISVGANDSKGVTASKWVDDAGNIIWPPNNGAVEGTEKIINMGKGTTFGRIGSEKGSFVAPPKTSPDKLSLTPVTDLISYTEYVVKRPIPGVEKATVAPWFDRPGGGTQFKLPMSIRDLIRDGYIAPK